MMRLHPKVKRFLWTFLLFSLMNTLQAQVISTENLVYNGNFEMGNSGFKSDYVHNYQYKPGQYVITNNAEGVDGDLKNPYHGDHTTGHGQYLVVNSDGQRGKRVWYAAVKVIPNSRYYFSAHFCNVFKHGPAKTSFEFSSGDIKGNDPHISVSIGNETVLTERDFYHVWRWVGVDAFWYSGSYNGTVYIAIENINTTVFGNDLAIDDIGFFFVETMPKDYRPPVAHATIVDKEYVEAKNENERRRRKLSEYGEFEMRDTLANGIYEIRYKAASKNPPKEDSIVNPRIRLQSLSFNQGKAYLLPPAMKQLDLIAEWMKSDSLIRVRFIGHTDNVGDSLLNIKLSEERVRNVRQYLISKGIAENRIEIVGVGGAFPIADNNSAESRRLNRRVEMEILKP